MPAGPSTIVIEYRALPGKHELARRRLADLIAVVVALEPDCLGIWMSQDAADPTRLLLYERWTDLAIFQGPHMTTPHLLQFRAEAHEFLTGPPQTTFWSEVCQVTPPVREAAAT
jgi:quinol monooxygenase YgiN